MNFTKEQQKAIDIRQKEVVVSAAAGSGKTAVLVERILQRIIGNDFETPIDIDQFLIVTFTKAAAAEMKERLTKSIGEKIIQTDPATSLFRQLRRQLFLLNKATITTIDAFCRKIVMQSFHLVGVDPGFKTLDPKQEPILIAQCMLELFNERYDNEDPLFLELVEIYGGKYSDENLSSLVLDLYKTAREDVDPKAWIIEKTSVFSEPSSYKKIYLPLLKSQLEHFLKEAVSCLEQILHHAKMGVPKYIDDVNEKLVHTKSALDYLQKEHITLLQIHDFITENIIPSLPGIRKKIDKEATDDEHKVQARDIFDKIKINFKDLKDKDFFISEEQATKHFLQMSRYMTGLSNLVLDFYNLYEKTKIDQNMLDFSDMSHFAIQALSHSEVLANFSYEEVFIDEYQDSNKIQEFILSRIAKSRFIVGDIKQSIYRFRGAVPQLFNDRLKEGDFIALSQNFRSRKSVIDGTNHIFKQLLPPTNIDYGLSAQLHLGAKYPEINNDTVEIHVSESKDIDEEKIDLEAAIISNRIKSLMKNMKVTTKDGQTRNLQYSDIVILSRNKTHMPELVDFLKNKGIPSVSESSANFFETQEIMTIVSWLHIIDNPMQDIPMLAVLNSPIYDITADELVTIRKKDTGLFCFAVEKYIESGNREELKEKLQKFLDDLQDFREYSSRNETVNLIVYILEKTNYLNYVAKHSGQIGLDNVNIIIEHADSYIKKDLYSFIRYIEHLIERKITIGEATGQSAINAVSIMTIHKSKGLEYPVVFLCNTGKKFNEKDSIGDIIIHKQLGLGPKYIELENRIKKHSIASQVLSNIIKKENTSEEVRLLYVASTRAKEKLIFISSVNDLPKHKIKWKNPHNSESLFSCKTYIDMIMPCVTEKTNGFELFYYDEKIQDYDYEKTNQVKENNQDQVFILSKPYKGSFVNIPANLNISQIKNNLQKSDSVPMEIINDNLETEQQDSEQQDESKNIVLQLPTFMLQKTGLSPTQIGNAHHTVMEHIRFDETNVVGFISELYKKNFLTDQEVEVIRIHWIKRFLGTNIAKRMSNAEEMGKLYRETPFAMKISPKEAYILDCNSLDNDEKILVHGIIDIYFEEDDEIVLVDYKTDNVKSPQIIKDRYELQINFYKKALENIMGKRVKESVIYMFNTGEIIQM